MSYICLYFMRTFIISDIHGDNEAFRKALKHVSLKKDDLLILLGDYIDRGFDSKGVLDTIMLLIQHDFNLICLRGNHEQMLLDAIADKSQISKWFINGGDATLSSFLTSSIEKIPYKYIELINSFRHYYLHADYIFVHAALNMKAKDPFEDTETMLWSRTQEDFIDYEWLGDRKIIHGHNPTSKDDILNSIAHEKIICIDNGVFLKRIGFGNICILELENLNAQFIS